MAKKRKVAAKKSNGAVRRTRATVTMELLGRKSGVTIDELVKAFKDEFGNGKVTTARIAITKVPKGAKKKVIKEKSESRGTVYYLA